MKVGELFVVLGLDNKEFERGLDSSKKSVDSFSTYVNKKFTQIGEGMKNLGTKMSLFLTAPLTLVGRKAIQMASDVVESENLFEVSMGSMGKAARQWSIDLSKALGLNQYEVRKTLATFNVMLGSMGFSEEAAYSMAKGLTQLSYDMSSFYNLKPEQAFEKLQSGISGEIEPLKQLGILVSDTIIQQWALQHGWIREGQQLSENQKILARYNVIMEATRKAQGDLARTMDSPANTARRREAQLAEAQVEAGKRLLDATKAINLALGRLAEMFLKLPPGMQSAIVYLAIFAAALGPLLYGLGTLILLGPVLIARFKSFSIAAFAARMVSLLKVAIQGLYIAMTRNPVTGVIILIAGALLSLALSSKTVRDWLDQVIARLRALAGLDYKPPDMAGADPSKVADAYDEYIKQLQGVGDATKDANKETKKFLASFDEVYQVPEENGGGLGGGIGNIPKPPSVEPPIGGGGGGGGGDVKIPGIDTIISGFQRLAEACSAAMEQIKAKYAEVKAELAKPLYLFVVYDPVIVGLTTVEAVAVNVASAIQTAWVNLQAATQVIWTNITTSLNTIWAAMQLSAQTIWSTVVQTINTSWLNVQIFTQAVWIAITSFLGSIWSTIVTTVQTSLTTVQTVITTVWTAILTFFQNIWSSIITIFNTAVTTIQTAIQTAWVVVQSVTTAVWTAVMTFWQSVWSTLQTVAQSAVSAIQNLALTAWNNISTLFRNVWTNITSFFANAWRNLTSITQTEASNIIRAAQRMAAGIISALSNLPSQLGAIASRAWSTFKARLIDPIMNWFKNQGGGGGTSSGGGKSNVVNFLDYSLSKGRVGQQPKGIPKAAITPVGAPPPMLPSLMPSLAPIPALAGGGIVNKATLAMVGEAGREAVVPLDEGCLIDYNRLASAIVEALSTTDLKAVLKLGNRELTQLERALQPARWNEAARRGML